MRTTLRVVGSIALLAWLGMRTDWGRLATAFAELDWRLWLAGVGLYLAVQVASSLRWQLLARPLHFGGSAWDYIRYTFIGMYFGLFLPSVGTDVVRAWYLDGGSGRKRAALLSAFLDRAIGLAVLLAIVLIAALAYPDPLPRWITASVAMTTACAVVGSAVLLLAVWRPGRFAVLLRLRAHTVHLARHPRALGGALAWSIAIQAGHVVVVWLIGQALAVPVPAAYYWVVVPLVSLVTLVPISINGIGVREASMVLLLAPLGVNEESAVTLVFLWFIAFTVAGASGLIFYLLGARQPNVAALRDAASSTEPEPRAAPAPPFRETVATRVAG